MYKKILVPLDGSPLSQCTLEPALALSKHADTRLLLVQAPLTTTLNFAAARHDALVYLETIHQSNKQPELCLETHLLDGDVAGAIVDTALSEQVDLICLSTQAYSGLTRWVLGNVTEKVLRHAPCPVLTVHAAQHPKKVLITLDGSPLANQAVGPGVALAQRLNASLTLLQVVPRVSSDGKLDEHERGLSRRLQEDLIEEAKEHLQARSEEAARSGVPIKLEVRIGSPAEMILEYVETSGIDLIVMATHGRTGLKRWVYGSVTAKVLRSVNCSMLVIPPTNAELN